MGRILVRADADGYDEEVQSRGQVELLVVSLTPSHVTACARRCSAMSNIFLLKQMTRGLSGLTLVTVFTKIALFPLCTAPCICLPRCMFMGPLQRLEGSERWNLVPCLVLGQKLLFKCLSLVVLIVFPPHVKFPEVQ